MTTFLIVAAILVVIVVAILARSLLRAPARTVKVDRREANLAIFRDQLAELERERKEGSLGEGDFLQARSELQRRLLEEVQAAEAPPADLSSSRKSALALLVVIPLAAAAGYALLGNPRALDPLQRQARVTPEQIEQMLDGLVEKLKKNPDDGQGWVMLARSYKALGRFPEAANAYGHAGAVLDQDAALLADYAEVLGQVSGGKLQGRPSELLARALRIDPDEPQALLLAGAAASERQDFGAAAEFWSRLLAQLAPGSEEAKTLAGAVDKAREIAAAQTGSRKMPGKPTDKATAATVSGEVVLSGRLAGNVKPDDVLFVFARAEEGPRMPLAVTRATVAELPLRFRLDDSMALPGGRKISEFRTVGIEARIAKAGKAQSSSGDLFGRIDGVKTGSGNLRVVIDQVQP